LFLFFPYVSYKQRYCDAKFESRSFLIKKRSPRRRSYGEGMVSFCNFWHKRRLRSSLADVSMYRSKTERTRKWSARL